MKNEESSTLTTEEDLALQFYRANLVLLWSHRLAHPYGVQTLRAEMEQQGFTKTEATETLLFLLEHNMLVISTPDEAGNPRYGLPDKSVSPYYVSATASGVRLTASGVFDDAFGRPMIELRIEGKSGRPGRTHTFSYEALLRLIAQANEVRGLVEQRGKKETTVS